MTSVAALKSSSRLRPVVQTPESYVGQAGRLRRAGCPRKPLSSVGELPEIRSAQRTSRENSKVLQIEGHEDKSPEQGANRGNGG
jgi:hypothetical protein